MFIDFYEFYAKILIFILTFLAVDLIFTLLG